MSKKMLFLLRKIVRKLSIIRGSSLILNLVHKYYFKKALVVNIRDFDGDLKMQLRLNEHMQSQIFWRGYYNRDIQWVLHNVLKSGMVVVDAGANVGEVTLIAAKLVGDSGKVYAFEPQKDVAAELSINVDANNFNQVSIELKGLSDEVGEKSLYIASCDFADGSKNEGLATLYPSDRCQEEAGTIILETLDHYVEQNNICQLNLIKMDIEGAELPALKGSMKTLKRFKPYIIVEVQQETASQAGYYAEDILKLLEKIGYQFSVIGRKGQLRPIQKNSLGKFQNVLCTPQCVN